MEKSKAILVDVKRCVGCGACEQACQQLHGFAQAKATHLSATNVTFLEEKNGKFVRRMCMHCEQPACASACLVGALKKDPLGPVTYDATKCMGCRYCMIACPQSVPKYEWSKLAPYVKKCDMCVERVRAGKPTTCAEACPAEATVFGNREDMLKEAWGRVRGDATYVQRVYGSQEFGGTSVFWISDVAFEDLGFVKPPIEQPLPTLSKAALSESPITVVVGGSILSAIYWVTQRRRDVALAENPHNEERN